MRQYLFQLPDRSRGGLQAQVREMLVSAILDGHIPAGAALPSCRRLAQQLGVARNTVVLAYQHLVDEGYLLARERSGYYVNGDILAGRVSSSDVRTRDGGAAGTSTAPSAVARTGASPSPGWSRRLQVTPAALRGPARPRDWQRYPYPFVYGQIDPDLFPIADWRECSRQALSVQAIRAWANDSIDSDDPMLIEQLHTRVLPRRGVWAAPDEILVTLGAQQSLYLIAALLVGRRNTVGIEEPGYADARNIFSMHAGTLLPLPVDGDGVQLTALDRCDYIYLTPSHQCPTTVTMTLARRQALLELAARHDIVLIEDDYEAETNYLGAPTPALKSMDADGRVIYVGSLSKTLAPGLRLGFMVAPAPLIAQARALRRFMLRHPPANNARAAALFLSLGHHDSLVRRLSHSYRERWQVMHAALEKHLPGAAVSPTFGGTSYWVCGPAHLDVAALYAAAAADGVLIERGDVHFQRHPAPRNYFRLGFAAIAAERIEPGIARLAQHIERLTSAAAGTLQ